LDEILSRQITTFARDDIGYRHIDEVHHATDCTSGREPEKQKVCDVPC